MEISDKQIFEQFEYTVGEDSKLARSYIEKLNFSSSPYLLNCIALTYRDQALFKKNGEYRKRISKKYLLEAKSFSDKAFKLNSKCINVLFIRGTILNHLDKVEDSIDCFLRIIQFKRLGSKKINCGDSDLDLLRMIQNDAYFQLFRLFRDTNLPLAKKFFSAYENGLKEGIDSLYKPIDEFI